MVSRKTETFREAQRRNWGLPVPSHLTHGKNTWAARTYGCDCKTCLPSGCRTWKFREDRPAPLTPRERRQRSRQKLRGQPVPDTVKHGIYAARVYGCACDTCMTAKRAHTHRRKNPWMYRPTRGHWSPGIDRAGKTVDRIWWPREGEAAEDCPFESCFHADHKETRP